MSQTLRATRRTRGEMIEETRGKLLATAREAFATQGYANTSMDEFTSSVGLTRGALYHHFQSKKGLFTAVVNQIDEEVDKRMQEIVAAAPNQWEAFRQSCRAYLESARDPEVRRIVLQDARAVLGGITPAVQQRCNASMKKMLEQLMEEGIVVKGNAEVQARMIDGAVTEAVFWIAEANEDYSERVSEALDELEHILSSFLKR